MLSWLSLAREWLWGISFNNQVWYCHRCFALKVHDMLFDCLFVAHFHVSLKGGLGAGLPRGPRYLVVDRSIWVTREVLSPLHEPPQASFLAPWVCALAAASLFIKPGAIESKQSCITTWMDLEIIIPKGNQTQISYNITHMWNLLEMIQISLFTKQK